MQRPGMLLRSLSAVLALLALQTAAIGANRPAHRIDGSVAHAAPAGAVGGDGPHGAAAPTRPHWVYFTDKGADAALRLATCDAATLGLAPAALLRRAQAAGLAVDASLQAAALRGGDALLTALRGTTQLGTTQRGTAAAVPDRTSDNKTRNSVVSAEDLPVAAAYIGAVRATGATIRATSRWMNAVSVDADAAQLARIAALPCVARTEAVRRWKPAPVPAVDGRTDAATAHAGSPDAAASRAARAALGKAAGTAALDYGESFDQLEMIHVPDLHDIWIDGTDILVGMLDNGFRWRSHEAMRNIKVLGEYDFIQKDTITENNDNDPAGQDSHGTLTFSALAGFKNGVLVGPAYNASFYLAKTEVNGSETSVEEDYWAQGIEWLESKGIAVASSSLGYSTWDDGTGYSYANGDFNGHTAVTTIAAARAARLGVVVNTAMGNEGPGMGTLIAPSDADTVISVGAVNFSNEVAGFSSRGPTNDNRIKPDVMAPGVSVFSASRYDTASYQRSSGTSLATPLCAGVAALIRSARPEMTPVQVRDALRATADQTGTPDWTHGWGTINAWDALLYSGMAISTNPKVLWDGTHNAVAAWIVSPHAVDMRAAVVTYRVDGASVQTRTMEQRRMYPGIGTGSGMYMATLPVLPTGALVEYYVSGADEREQRTSPYGAPARWHRFRVGESHIEGAENLMPKALSLALPYPNPVCTCRSALVRYDVPMPGADVRLDVYDELGRRVATLVDGHAGGGAFSVVLDGAALGSGAHFLALTSGGTQIVRPFMVVK